MENRSKPAEGISSRGANKGCNGPSGSRAGTTQRGALNRHAFGGDRCPASPHSCVVTQVGAEDRQDHRCPWGPACGCGGL